MSKQPNIRWRKRDNETLRKAVKNYNAKITRLERNKPDLSNVLPERITVKEMRGLIKTRKDFNAQIDKLKDFAKREIHSGYDIHREITIKWTDKETAALTSAIKEFNKKIDRLARKNPKIKNALPPKATVKQYKRIIGSKDALKREIKSLSSFLEDGAEDLTTIPISDYKLKITQWQKNEMETRGEVINVRREELRKEIDALEMTGPRGEELGYTVGEFGMPSADAAATAPMNIFTAKQTRSDLNAKFRNILREYQDDYWDSRYYILKQTYMNTLETQYNKNDIKDVLDSIEKMDFKVFYNKFKSSAGKFEFAYPDDNTKAGDYLSALKSAWIPDYIE